MRGKEYGEENLYGAERDDSMECNANQKIEGLTFEELFYKPAWEDLK